LNPAKVIQKYLKYIKASTDVTGFGIIGHSDNLVQIQKEQVDFHFDFLPVYGEIYKLKNLRRNYKLL
jgi:selenide,water dikinase